MVEGTRVTGPVGSSEAAGKRAGVSGWRGASSIGWLVVASMVALAAIPVPAQAAPAAGAKKAPTKAVARPTADETTGDDWVEKPEAPASGGRAPDPEFGEPPDATESEPEQRPSPLTPPPEEMPDRVDAQASDPARLLAELVALRARVDALTAALYESKLQIHLEADGDDARIVALTVTVDGGVVYTAPASFVGAEGITVYEHAVAPGRHVIGVEVERSHPRSPGHRTWQATRYAVDVPEKRTLAARIEVEDDSSMDDPTSGEYRVISSLSVEVLAP